jgi:putative membrane protein
MKKIVLLACALALAIMVPIAGARTHHHAKRHDAVSGLDKEYLQTSLAGDMFEIRGGRLAERRSHNAAVLKLARTLIKDHSQSFSDDSKLARKLGVEVPKQPLPSMVWELKAVASRHGKAFDRWYSSLEVYDHHQDIQESSDEVKDGTNSEVRDSARTEIPTLEKHLDLAQKAYRASK